MTFQDNQGYDTITHLENSGKQIQQKGMIIKMKEHISKVLKAYRKKRNYTVEDVALLLKDHNIHVATKTIYGWESGQSQPNADILLTLCELYKIENILSTFKYSDKEDFQLSSQECALIKSYRAHPDVQNAVNILLQHRG